MPATPALDVRDLRMSYRGRAVVDGLSLTAARGEITAVLGPNGAGKTTTVECCEGLRTPDAGTIRVLGEPPGDPGPRRRGQVGVMLQDGGLPTAARAGELLRHVAALHADPLRPDHLLELLGITDHARTAVRRLSGGQRQRLGLALALVGRPALTFLDEPTTGLDPQSRHAVWDLLDTVRADGVAVLLTTHAMDEAARLADQVLIMNAGSVVAAGSPAELTGHRRAADDGTTGADLLRVELAAPWTGSRPLPSPPEGCLLESPSPATLLVRRTGGGPVTPEMVARVTSWLARHGVLADRIEVGRRTLEDVFLDLTGRALR